ncbi:hypothetical protein TrRE_jg3797 [Triparma retinervis]|uniref:Methyltransferase domain-containing protein n=1 Tax=Triparma retinervis TaxID=2557542 RepID=A0A9W7F6C3_9STRA|nr:hypothetical protein TrRE_jg3797 [Triparma retinervis]
MVASRIFDTLGHSKGPAPESSTRGTTHLDLGCGWGSLNRAALGRPSISRTIGVDNDGGMIKEAERRVGVGEVDGTDVRWVEGDLKACADLREYVGESCTSALITTYMVTDGLTALRPLLGGALRDIEHVTIITVDYEIEGWAGREGGDMMGLTWYIYNLDSMPVNYQKALSYLDGDDTDGEVGLATTGIARSRKALGSYAGLGSQYRSALLSVGRGDRYAETEADMVASGIQRNPYLGWEYGDALRREGRDQGEAFRVLDAAGDAFEGIGDPVRGYMSQVESCIALASYDPASAISKLERVVPKSTRLEGRDVGLLQRAVGKECEGRVLLASLYWEKGEKARAEDAFGEAEARLAQLEDDYVKRIKGKGKEGKDEEEKRRGGFSIDDTGPAVGEVSAAKFKKAEWVEGTLGWGERNGERLTKFIKLA